MDWVVRNRIEKSPRSHLGDARGTLEITVARIQGAAQQGPPVLTAQITAKGKFGHAQSTRTVRRPLRRAYVLAYSSCRNR